MWPANSTSLSKFARNPLRSSRRKGEASEYLMGRERGGGSAEAFPTGAVATECGGKSVIAAGF